MEDNIELVIKISKEEYKNIKNAINSLIENGVERASMSKVCLAILDGNPLPKGHWIRVSKDKLRCSECDVIHFIAQYPLGQIAWCPNCGSRNVLESEEEHGKSL